MTLVEYYQQQDITLSQTEQYILLKLDQEFNTLPNFNITTIADFCNSSTTSVNRLITKLNFKNYQEFKFFMHSRIDVPLSNSVSQKSRLEINIFDFFTTFDTNTIDLLIRQIQEHETIYLVAVGQSKSLATYMIQNFIRFGKNIILVSESHLINTIHSYINNDSLVIFISSSGNTNSLLLEAKVLSNHKIDTYLLTNNSDCKLRKYMNKCITIPTTNFDLNGYQVYAQSPLFIFIDLLVLKYAQEQKV